MDRCKTGERKTKRRHSLAGDRRTAGWMRRLTALLFAVCLACLLAGCGSTKLADVFEEEQVKEAAQAAVDNLIAGEYEADLAMMSQALQEALSAETLAANMEMMNEQTGAFKEYKSMAVVGQRDSQGRDMAVVVIVAAFEKRSVTYTVSFNTDMKIDGLWMK